MVVGDWISWLIDRWCLGIGLVGWLVDRWCLGIGLVDSSIDGGRGLGFVG